LRRRIADARLHRARRQQKRRLAEGTEPLLVQPGAPGARELRLQDQLVRTDDIPDLIPRGRHQLFLLVAHDLRAKTGSHAIGGIEIQRAQPLPVPRPAWRHRIRNRPLQRVPASVDWWRQHRQWRHGGLVEERLQPLLIRA
jgi:hypothetical protein